MRVHVQKWGNSLALRIPQPFAKQIQVTRNSIVDLSLKEGRLVLTPVPHPKYTLKELVAKITPANIHQEIDTGNPRGRELW